ncbi:MAG: GNAT family N-acetyltransferase [Rhodothermales bacterium]
MSSFSIRSVARKDHAFWLTSRKEVYEENNDTLNKEEMELVLSSSDHTCFVLVNNTDEAIGFLELSLRNIVDGCLTSPVAYIEGQFVHADYRGQGLGRLLTEKAIEWAKEQGCTEIGTDALLTNEKAQVFHRQMGFEEVDRVVAFRMDIGE